MGNLSKRFQHRNRNTDYPPFLYQQMDNMKQPAAILVLQYWYTILVIPVSSSICNTGITSIFQYLQYWYYQYFPESSGVYNTHILAMTSIFQYCRYWKFWKILGNQYLPVSVPVLQILEDTGITSIVYQYCNTSIAAGCFILSIC